MLSSLRLSVHRRFDSAQRWASRLVWGRWLIGFLFWELTGLLSFTPWRTLSETAWDTEELYPGTRRALETFLLGLVIHIRYRYTLESSIEYAQRIEKNFDYMVPQPLVDNAPANL